VAGQCGIAPTELTTAAGCGAIHLALQGTDLYWTETQTGAVRSIPLAGGAATDVATGQLSPTQIAADASGIYWTNQGDGTAGSSTVMKQPLPLTATAPIALATSPAADPILAIAVSAGKVYYTLGSDVHQVSTDETDTTDVIVGTATNYDLMPPLPAGEPSALAVSDSVVVWATTNRNGVELDDLTAETTLDDMTGYVELGQSVGSLLVSNVGVDATYAYWADGDKFVRNTVDAMTPSGTIIWENPDLTSPISAFAIDAMNVYASVGLPGNSIYKHSLEPPADLVSDTTLIKVAGEQTNPTSVVLDATNVYWATEDCAIRYSAK
jgi:hypothetical protein